MWNAQFDHPYDGAYCEAWNNLPSADRKTLLLMAAQSGDRDSMFAPSLIAEVAAHGGASVGPILVRWTSLPQKKRDHRRGFYPQLRNGVCGARTPALLLA